MGTLFLTKEARINNRAKTTSSINGARKTEQLNVKPETIKLLKENTGRTINNINQSKILYDPPPRVMKIKTKVNKWNLIKLKSFCTAKETIGKVKTTRRMGEMSSK